ncbi:MAG: hypothetical protein OEX12_08990 [Gammaproteobacteria bacterium]|nr:hypothetical protein [Gammaproteobacteria bacterium]
MSKQRSNRDQQMRLRIAQEAARMMAEDGQLDFYNAKRKAATHLGADATHNLPQNHEVDDALQAYQRLFQTESHPQHLRHLRQTAMEAMRLFADFHPYLAGPVLLGTAGPHSEVQLHLYASTIEAVLFYLMDQGIPYQQSETFLRFNNDEQAFPCLRFVAGEDTIELVILPDTRLHPAPKSPLNGKPMKRASFDELENLLQQND